MKALLSFAAMTFFAVTVVSLAAPAQTALSKTEKPADGINDIDNLHVHQKIEVGNSIIIDGYNGNPGATNNIYTDGTLPLLIESKSGMNSNTILNADNSGKVGIGTKSPKAKLEIAEQTGTGLLLTYPSYPGGTAIQINNFDPEVVPPSAGGKTFSISSYGQAYVTSLGVGIDPATAPRIRLQSRVGTENITGLVAQVGHNFDYGYCIQSRVARDLTKAIAVENTSSGTDKENFLVYGNGHVYAREITVTLGTFADYVFADGYELTPLEDLDQYIRVNKHLPGIPSEEEIVKNGLSVGEMQKTLVKKIEELTLYMIDLKRENQKLNKKIAEFENQ